MVPSTKHLNMSACICGYGSLARHVKLRVAHAPGMPGTFPPPPRVSDPNMHHGTCMTYVPWCMPGSLTSGFICSRCRRKRSRHSRRMRNRQYCVSCKRPMCVRGSRNHESLPWLTHGDRKVTYICGGKLIIIGSDNGLSLNRRQAII